MLHRRIQTTQLLRRMLEARTVLPTEVGVIDASDTWALDLNRFARAYIREESLDAWGPLSTAINLYKSFVTQLTEMSDELPEPSNSDQTLSDEQVAYLASMELWAEAQQHTKNVVGLGDSLKHLTWHGGITGVGTAGVSVRLVTPDRVEVWDHPEAPGVPVRIAERVTMAGKDRLIVWSFGVLDKALADKTKIPADLHSEPYFAVVQAKSETEWIDITTAELEDPPEFEWFDDSVTPPAPYLPWVLYNLKGTWWCEDPWPEIATGTFEVALLWSFFQHAVWHASWAQKYGIGVQPVGADVDAAGTHSVPVDPTTIPLFEDSGTGRGVLGVLNEPMDPAGIAEAVQSFVTSLLESVGFGGIEGQVTTAESGIAITLRRDQVRKVQKKITVPIRRGDLEMLEKVALISNHFGEDVPDLPVEGWTIKYPSLPKTHDETTQDVDEAIRLKEEGAASDVDVVIAANPGTTREEALTMLVRAAVEAKTAETQAQEELLRLKLVEPTSAPSTSIVLAPTDLAAVITVNEARAIQGLGTMEGGDLTITAFRAKAEADARPAAALLPPREEDDG